MGAVFNTAIGCHPRWCITQPGRKFCRPELSGRRVGIEAHSLYQVDPASIRDEQSGVTRGEKSEVNVCILASSSGNRTQMLVVSHFIHLFLLSASLHHHRTRVSANCDKSLEKKVSVMSTRLRLQQAADGSASIGSAGSSTTPQRSGRQRKLNREEGISLVERAAPERQLKLVLSETFKSRYCRARSSWPRRFTLYPALKLQTTRPR